MDYGKLAEKVGRSRSTVRKWRAKVEEISGHQFRQFKVRTGKRSYLVSYDFTADEAEQFTDLAKLLDEKVSLNAAISQVFGNKQLQEQSKQQLDMKTLKKMILSLSNEIRKTQLNVSALEDELSHFKQRLESLENRGFFSKIKKEK